MAKKIFLHLILFFHIQNFAIIAFDSKKYTCFIRKRKFVQSEFFLKAGDLSFLKPSSRPFGFPQNLKSVQNLENSYEYYTPYYIKSLKLSSSEQILQATSSGSLKFEKKRKFSSTFQERLEETKNKLEFVIAKNHESKNLKKKKI
ncbi:unnamed protein product [Rhizophagus irregularis]|nr:unnamed protein product [Rhizophagus irregularis]